MSSYDDWKTAAPDLMPEYEDSEIASHFDIPVEDVTDRHRELYDDCLRYED